jgi:site-specific DNA-methyltransferase (adenine-specific)
LTFDLRLGDCLDPVTGLSSLADKSIDVVMTDPPYSEHVHSKSRRGLTQDNRTKAKQARGLQPWEPGDISERRELGFESLTAEVMQAAARAFASLARRWVLVFCDERSDHAWREALISAGLEYIRTCAWHKLGGAPQFTGDRPAVWGEYIVLCHPKGRKRWNGGGKQGLYAVPTAIDRDRSGLDERMHTTQKPVALMEALIRDFTDPGESICDPFAGSGTTLLAALRLGRRSIGWERDAENHAKAQRRLQGEKQLPGGFLDERQGALFG